MEHLQPKSYRQPVEVTFTFPPSLQAETGYVSVTIKELTGASETRAITRAGTDGGKLMNELVRESLVNAVKVDGTLVKISTADESIDVVMAEIGPKGRGMLMQAYGSVNQPTKDDVESFLASATAKVQ